MENSHEILMGEFNYRSFRFTQTSALHNQFEILVTLFGIMYSSVMPVENSA
jgi:hypothetical protein